MSVQRDDGGPAFPAGFDNNTGSNIMVGGTVIPPGARVDILGLSMRDYFAAKAMRCVHAEYVAAGEKINLADYQDIAADAYRLADAMLRARAA